MGDVLRLLQYKSLFWWLESLNTRQKINVSNRSVIYAWFSYGYPDPGL